MKVSIVASFLLAAAGSIGATDAGEIPGADDLALRAAAKEWLRADDPRPAMRAVGELAVEGNTAARLLANTMFYECGSDFPEMSREECLALFPPDADDKGTRFRPYRAEWSDRPLQWITPMAGADEWIERAEELLDAGLRERFLQELSIMVTNQKTVDIEAALFAEDIVTFADREAVDLWLFLGLAPGFVEMWERSDPKKAASRRARWGGPPWTPEREARLLQALSEGRWPAARAVGFLMVYGIELPIEPKMAELYRRWIRLTLAGLTNDLEDEPPPTEEELQRLGALLIRDAARTPYLRPNLNACESACPDDISYGMASGVLNRVELRYMPSYLQPIVPAMTYYDSPRAMRALLVESGGMARRRGWGPDWLRVPQCFADAATEAVDRRRPRPAAPN